MYFTEDYQDRIGYSLSKRPDLYIKNSPIFRTGQVSTPFLMMHNIKDGGVPWTQAVELFTGLRRLGKKVWMLQYDDGNHGVAGKDALDYTIRLTQFFDHYLKGAPPPKWMTEGIPARLKGIETGYELTPNESCSDSCPVCKKKDYKAYYDELLKMSQEKK